MAGLVDEDGPQGTCFGKDELRPPPSMYFSMEPPEDTELLNLPNFLATPHIGGSAEEAILAMGGAAIAGLDDNAVPGPEMMGKG